MTQEDKSLLLKDLCARLPYEVKVQVADYRTPVELSHINTKNGNGRKPYCFVFAFEPERVKPYLRPLSSMSDKEREEWTDLFMAPIIELEEHYEEDDVEEVTAPQMFTKSHCKSINWLLERHFDINGLIEKDLAIVVTEENNPYKE